MSSYSAEVFWERRDTDEFLASRYSRRHTLRFDGGFDVPGSSSPHVVPAPYSDPSALDPEEALVASLASCHMLWFLAIAAKRQYCVDSYADKAEGVMAKNAEGKMAVTVITLRPDVRFSGEKRPTHEQLDALHHEAHEACFIASSVKSEVRCEPVYPG